MEKRTDVDVEALELDEKHVADDIEKALPQPMSIEGEALIEAAELEELKFNQD